MPYIKTWNISSKLLYVLHIGCGRSRIFTWHAQLPFNYHCEGMMISRHYALPVRRRRIVRASMFDDGALWLISGDWWGDSRVEKSIQGGILKGKWFHFNARDFRRKKKAGKGQSALYLPFRPGFRSEKKRKAGARCSEKLERYGRDALELTPLNSVFMKSPRKSPLWSQRSERGDGGELFEGPVSLLLSEARRYVFIIIS